MPVAPTYPGVYIEELPSSVRTITGVATSITAFIGRARRGPVNEPVMINSYGDYERIFGGLWTDSALSYAVRDFYLNGGVQAVIVRLFHPLFVDDAQRVAADTAAHAVAKAVADQVTKAGADATVTLAAVKTAATTAAGAFAAVATPVRAAAQSVADAALGAPPATTRQFVKSAARAAARAAANLAEPRKSAADRVAVAAESAAVPVNANAEDVYKATAAESTKVAAEAAAAGTAAGEVKAAVDTAAAAAGATVNSVKLAARAQADSAANAAEPRKSAANRVATKVEQAAAAAGATTASLQAAATAEAAAIASESAAQTDAAAGVAAAARTEELKDFASIERASSEAAQSAAPEPTAQISSAGLSLSAASPGAWGNQLRARVDYDVPDALNGFVKADLFNLSLRDGSTGAVEVFRNLTVKAGPQQVAAVLKNQSQLARWNGAAATVPQSHEPAKPGQNVWADNAPATCAAVTQTGSDGGALSSDEFIGAGLEGNKQGLFALEQVDLFNLLAIPPYKGADVDTGLVSAAASYCEKRRALFIIDPPSQWTSKDAAKGDGSSTGVAAVGTASRNAALYFPRLRQPDPLRNNQACDFAPCGAVAGVMARIDSTRGVWKAPAGLEATLVNVPEVSVKLTDLENGELNPLGVNCLRNMPGAGRVVWGSRTLEGNDRLASQWKYVPVRRTALYIEESLYRGTQWVVFEPNAEPLWAQIRLNVGAFMNTMFRQGAFAGTSPRDAYFVKCDSETTTQNDVNLGIVNIVVGFAPLKPAEFVIIKIQQLSGQIAS